MLNTDHLIEFHNGYPDLVSTVGSSFIQSADTDNVHKEYGETADFEVSISAGEDILFSPEPAIPESSNIDIAKELNGHKQHLIRLLSRLPLTALCLLLKYEQKCGHADDSNTSELDSSIDTQLSVLSMYFQNAQQFALNEGLKSPNYLQAKQKVIDSIRNFPFSAEQLKKTAALVIYSFYQHNPYSPEQTKTGSIKRKHAFEKILNLSNLSAAQLKQELKQLSFEFFNNATLMDFLLPPGTVTQQLAEDIITTEQLWLKARQQLAQANTRLVFFIANQYKGSFLEFSDLAQEGQSGLLKAVDRFDHERGFQFSTYAAYWIRQAISRALSRNERVVRLPFGKMANIHKVNRAKQQLCALNGCEPSIKELAAHTKLSETDVANILIIAQTATSLDAPVDEDDHSVSKVDYLEQQVFEHPLANISENELTHAISNAIGFLSPKEAQVINCRFGINAKSEMTLEEIGHELHLTRERVRQIQIAAMQKIKRRFGAQLSIFL